MTSNPVERSPNDPRLEKTTNSRSPDIEEMNEDFSQPHNIYLIQNCGSVCMSVDSFNAQGVRMENCNNNVPHVTCSFSFLLFLFSSWLHDIIQTTVLELLAMRKFYIQDFFTQTPMVCGHLRQLAIKHAEYLVSTKCDRDGSSDSSDRNREEYPLQFP